MDETQELEDRADLVEFNHYKSLKKASLIANAIATVAAVSAIVFCLFLLKLRSEDQAQMACRGRINSYANDLRDDIDTTGWAALVTISLNREANTPTNQDPKAIAKSMYDSIELLQGRARQLRTDAFQICQDDPDFEPR